MKDSILNFKKIGDGNIGYLISLEANRNVPFDIKRLYYIFGNTCNARRGFHAHKNLKQVAVVVRGSCKFLIDNGTNKAEVVLDSPDKGLLIEGHIWREMYDFSEDCVICVLADNYYEEEDYIRDYQEFLAYINTKKLNS